MVDGPDALSKEAQRNATLLFFSHLRATFASKRVLREYKLTPEAFDWILGEVETRFNQVQASQQYLSCFCIRSTKRHLHHQDELRRIVRCSGLTSCAMDSYG